MPALAALGAAALAAGCGGPEEGGGRPGGGAVAVQVVTVEPRPLPEVIEAVGSVESAEPTVISARVAGEVVAVDLPEGEHVEAGRVLVRLDDEEVRAAIRAAEARRQVARETLRRTRKLHEEGVTSDQALDDAEAAFEEARAAVAEAKARLRYTEVRAPFDGRLGLRRIGLGDVLAPGTPIVEMTPAADALEIRFFVPQEDAPRLGPGLALHGRLGPCGPRFEGELAAQAARLDPSSRTLAAEARLTQTPADGRLAPGMGVRLRILVDEREGALVVPRSAIVRRGTRRLVWVLGEDDTAQPREVRLGAFFPDGVHVTEGLEAGDRVVAAGQIKLRPGAPTEPRPWEPTRNPNLELGRFGPPDACGPFGPGTEDP
ncbi:MAG: efflux RND transporter periplasmic adaptor subunit [Myxococcota bacterium]|nr:efflux RND transporter periplasmic adaptor subunit [Myxococcota bacterium]